MKKLTLLMLFSLGLSLASLSGCDSSETKVIEAPPAVEEEDPAMAGMTEEEYNKAMEESMK